MQPSATIVLLKGGASPVSPVAGRDYPRSYAELRAWFDQDTTCLDYLDWLRWPDGFVCPGCGSVAGWLARRQVAVRGLQAEGPGGTGCVAMSKLTRASSEVRSQGVPGRGALGKVLFAGAVEVEEHGFGRARLGVIADASAFGVP